MRRNYDDLVAKEYLQGVTFSGKIRNSQQDAEQL
jgi:hypothetical protein